MEWWLEGWGKKIEDSEEKVLVKENKEEFLRAHSGNAVWKWHKYTWIRLHNIYLKILIVKIYFIFYTLFYRFLSLCCRSKFEKGRFGPHTYITFLEMTINTDFSKALFLLINLIINLSSLTKYTHYISHTVSSHWIINDDNWMKI